MATASLLLLFAPLATAQDVTTTEWDGSAEGPTEDASKSTLQPGQSAPILVKACVGWGSPGLNPQDGSFKVVLALVEDTGPDWATIVPPTEEHVWAPAATVTEDAPCASNEKEWELPVTLSADAPRGEIGTFEFTMTVSTDGDVGTFQPLSGEKTVSADIGVEAPIDDPLNPTGDPDGNETNGGGGNGDNEESPLPAPLVPVLTLVGLAAWRRRRA